MIDPMSTLAFSVYSGKRAYALLLGSGVSRDSGIPTAWEIVLDLIRRLAAMEGKSCADDPASWYATEYLKDPGYSDLLAALAKTSAERGKLLNSYIEPTEEDREQGKKMPTPAHRAIAKLVADGFISVIITTNFDRLMERALDEAGVVPTVIASSDAIQGATPLPHATCTVIKVHGDYLDTRLKNTLDELETYDPAMDKLLDRIFDEYGLIVCGWSADWDVALRKAIERCPNRRFTTFWSAYRELSDRAKEVCAWRQAEMVVGRDANTFFGDLCERVTSLAEIGGQHPVTAVVAVATMKRYLAEDRYRIRLYDLLMAEVDRFEEATSEESFPLQRIHSTLEADGGVVKRLSRYERLSEMLVTGGYWGDERHPDLWIRAIERIARPSEGQTGDPLLLRVTRYPAILLLYGCGIAALASARYATLVSLFTQGQLTRSNEERAAWVHLLDSDTIAAFDGIAPGLPELKRFRFVPLSAYLRPRLQRALRDYLPGEREFDQVFNRFEYYGSLLYADQGLKSDGDEIWGPLGWYVASRRKLFPQIQKEIEEQRGDFPLLKAGGFRGSLDRLLLVKKRFDEWVSGIASHHGIWG